MFAFFIDIVLKSKRLNLNYNPSRLRVQGMAGFLAVKEVVNWSSFNSYSKYQRHSFNNILYRSRAMHQVIISNIGAWNILGQHLGQSKNWTVE